MTLQLFNLTELSKRWNVTKQYVNKLKKEDMNFPEPVMTKGRTHLYTLEQIQKYEANKNFHVMHTNRLERIEREGKCEKASEASN